MLWTAKVSSKGQVIIPKPVRERVELEPMKGSILEWYGAISVEGPQDFKAIREQTMAIVAEEVAREDQGG